MHEVQLVGSELETLLRRLENFDPVAIPNLVRRMESLEQLAQTLEPWVGPEGQLRVRLERSEQAILALLEDPGNPYSSADKARMILTTIPTPQA